MRLNNFNGALQINSALNSSAIFRLSSLFEQLTERETQELQSFRSILSRENNYKVLREAISRGSPPTLPYLGMYLTDLIFIEEGQADLTPDGLINFSKRRQVAAIIAAIQQLQLHDYVFTPVPEFREYLEEFPSYDDDYLYQLSLYISPRGGGEPTVDRLPVLDYTEMVRTASPRYPQPLTSSA